MAALKPLDQSRALPHRPFVEGLSLHLRHHPPAHACKVLSALRQKVMGSTPAVAPELQAALFSQPFLVQVFRTHHPEQAHLKLYQGFHAQERPASSFSKWPCQLLHNELISNALTIILYASNPAVLLQCYYAHTLGVAKEHGGFTYSLSKTNTMLTNSILIQLVSEPLEE